LKLKSEKNISLTFYKVTSVPRGRETDADKVMKSTLQAVK